MEFEIGVICRCKKILIRFVFHCFYLTFSQDHSYAKHLPTATVPTSNILNIDDVGVGGNATVFTTTSLDAAAESWEGSVTRCICEFQHDDGFMICCERCEYVLNFSI